MQRKQVAKISGTGSSLNVFSWVVKKLPPFRNSLNSYGFLIKLVVLTSTCNLILLGGGFFFILTCDFQNKEPASPSSSFCSRESRGVQASQKRGFPHLCSKLCQKLHCLLEKVLKIFLYCQGALLHLLFQGMCCPNEIQNLAHFWLNLCLAFTTSFILSAFFLWTSEAPWVVSCRVVCNRHQSWAGLFSGVWPQNAKLALQPQAGHKPYGSFIFFCILCLKTQHPLNPYFKVCRISQLGRDFKCFRTSFFTNKISLPFFFFFFAGLCFSCVYS